MIHSEFVLENYQSPAKKGSFSWEAPSNIALVKYWGKHGIQLPANPSLSFTLSKSATQTRLDYRPLEKKTESISFDVFFEGKKSESFRPKIAQYFERIQDYLPFISDYHFEIHTQNTFPHSSGIASSASGMAALSCCLISLEKELTTEQKSEEYYDAKAGFLARLGSGSATRSTKGPVMIWGQHPAIADSNDLYAVEADFQLHSVFENLHDCILIVDKGKKQVSSSVGHDLMIGHPFADSRFDQAYVNLDLLKQSLIKGDLKEFIKIVESEALTLHAMMMTSAPYFILMKPQTLEIIQKIWEFRETSGSHACFTLDAGANVHLLYPQSEKEAVETFIKNELLSFCQNGEHILDQAGNGARQLNA